jgi:hypothetical protein
MKSTIYDYQQQSYCTAKSALQKLVQEGGAISKQQSSLVLTKMVSSLSNNHSDVNILS